MAIVTSLGQIAINVKNLSRAVQFYRDVLGLKHLFDAGPKMSFFDCGSVRLMLALPERAEFDHPASILYYRVADLRAAHQNLLAKGVRFEQAPLNVAALPDHELWMAFARDSEDNLFALMAEVPLEL